MAIKKQQPNEEVVVVEETKELQNEGKEQKVSEKPKKEKGTRLS